MIIKIRSNPYLQLLSLFSWFFLSSVFLFNNISAGQDSWLQLCTQQGIKLVNVAVQSDAAQHSAEACDCTIDSFVEQPSLEFTPLVVTQHFASHYHFRPASEAYRPANPRAPPALRV
ncbi:MAG: hypothetical protein HRU06_18010 [Oceanospirillaceae bacterium]|nr:hypothetical protein [Oceanospirillaceae bacterium]